MSDYISRQAAISAICNACGKIDCDKMDKCEKLQLPPANCSEFPNSSDTISRQQAIEALDKRFDSIPMEQTSEILMLRKDLRNLPPAQPEQLGTNLAEVGTRAVRGYPIDADALMEKVAEEYGERARDRLYQIIRYMPPAQPHTYRGVTLNDVMMYFDSLEGNEDAWTELCSCFECRGWELIRIQDGDARRNFLDIVYAELADDPDNNRANKIIDAADEYAESAQLGTNLAEVGTDCISRQAIDKFIDGLEEIFADLREQHVDDSVCGLCEYDGAYIGQSGDWCNECPGFDKDDCFKLSDKTRKEWTEEIIKALPPSQPEPCEDAVSREEVLNCLEWQYPDKLPRTKIMELPPVTPKQPDLSEAYANAVFTWLMSYQIQSAQLKGRYTPYEVIGWVLNDWRKEHDAERDT